MSEMWCRWRGCEYVSGTAAIRQAEIHTGFPWILEYGVIVLKNTDGVANT